MHLWRIVWMTIWVATPPVLSFTHAVTRSVDRQSGKPSSALHMSVFNRLGKMFSFGEQKDENNGDDKKPDIDEEDDYSVGCTRVVDIPGRCVIGCPI